MQGEGCIHFFYHAYRDLNKDRGVIFGFKNFLSFLSGLVY